MRAFLRSSPVAPHRSRALAEATRLVWQGSSTAASVTVATSFHGCSARRACCGSRTGRSGARCPASSPPRSPPASGRRHWIRARSRGKTGAPLPRQRESSQRFAAPSQHRAPGRATGRHPPEQLSFPGGQAGMLSRCECAPPGRVRSAGASACRVVRWGAARRGGQPRSWRVCRNAGGIGQLGGGALCPDTGDRGAPVVKSPSRQRFQR